MSKTNRKKLNCIVRVNSCFEKKCAREIFSLFMLFICIKIKYVKSETHSNFDEYMTNNTFTKLVEKIFQIEFVDFTNDALHYVIFVFVKFELLFRLKSDELITSRKKNNKYDRIVKKNCDSNELIVFSVEI